MGGTHYGVLAQVTGEVNFSKIYHDKIDGQAYVGLSLNMTVVHDLVSNNIGGFSFVEAANYDTDGANAVATVTSTRCDKETLRPYFMSILRGGSCSSGGASSAATVSVVPTGNISGNDVQEVLEELDAEIGAISTGAQLWTNNNW